MCMHTKYVNSSIRITELAYTGRAAGSDKQDTDGTSNILCPQEEPDYMKFAPNMDPHATINGAQLGIKQTIINHRMAFINVPCAISPRVFLDNSCTYIMP